MTKRKIKRYSEAFRQEVVREYEAGSNIADLRKKYGIGGERTIQGWIEKYSHSGLRHQLIHIQRADEANRVRELEARVGELEGALGKVTLEKLILESTLEVLEAEYGIEAKKNAASSSSGPTKKGNTKPGGS
ncbi:MAG TPA: transposase [Anaerolineales bacterium]